VCHEPQPHAADEITKPVIGPTIRNGSTRTAATTAGRSPFVRNTRSSARPSTLRGLTKKNYLLSNPASDLDMPKLERHLPRQILTAQEAIVS